jgi:Zn-dependent M28 family amino/carboxypeptidase
MLATYDLSRVGGVTFADGPNSRFGLRTLELTGEVPVDADQITQSVSIDNLYRTVTNLHYFRDPVVDLANLVKAGEYIESKLDSFGLQTERQAFGVELSDEEFFNVVGVLNPGKTKEILITSHYDHLKGIVGADDNLSGVSIMIECARALSVSNHDTTVKFVAFTLEEYNEAISTTDDLGMRIALGSQNYVQSNLGTLSNIEGVINLEACGYTSSKDHSQSQLKGFDFESFPTHNVNSYTTGDYIFIVSDQISAGLGSRWFGSCRRATVNLPAMLLTVPLGFDDMRKFAPDLLRSDHAPFWHRSVPAIMITDGANFRNPYYHKPGDTVDTLDFEFMKKVTKATLSTVVAT